MRCAFLSRVNSSPCFVIFRKRFVHHHRHIRPSFSTSPTRAHFDWSTAITIHGQRRGSDSFSTIWRLFEQVEKYSWHGALTLARCALFPNGTEDPMPSSTQNQERSVMILKSLHIMSRHDARNWKGALTLASLEIRPTAQVLGTLLRVLRIAGRWAESLFVLRKQGSDILRYEDSYATAAECAAYIGQWDIALHTVAFFHSRIRATARCEVEELIPSVTFHAVVQRFLRGHVNEGETRRGTSSRVHVNRSHWWAVYAPGLRRSYLHVAQQWCVARRQWVDVLWCHARLCALAEMGGKGKSDATSSIERIHLKNCTYALLQKCNIHVASLELW